MQQVSFLHGFALTFSSSIFYAEPPSTISQETLLLMSPNPCLKPSYFNIEAKDKISNNNSVEDDTIRDGVEYEVQYKYNNLMLISGLNYIYEGECHGFLSSFHTTIRLLEVCFYNLLNLYYRYNFTKVIEFFSSITNMLENKIMYPTILILTTRKIKTRNGTGFLLGFNYELGN